MTIQIVSSLSYAAVRPLASRDALLGSPQPILGPRVVLDCHVLAHGGDDRRDDRRIIGEADVEQHLGDQAERQDEVCQRAALTATGVAGSMAQ